MGDLISVIVPVYNTGRYLENCVSSILLQDYRNIEIILVDDGSEDVFTIDLCERLSNEYANIRCLRKANGGSASARNYGIRKAAGKYIGFVDSDDVIEPSMYSSLYSDLVSSGVRISIGNMTTEKDGRIINKSFTMPSGVYSNTELLHFFFLGHWHSACTNLYDRSLFESVLFPEGEVNEDYMLNYFLYRDQMSVYYNEHIFYHYIKREFSNTSSPVSLAFLDWIKHTSSIQDDFRFDSVLSEEAEYQYIFSNIVLGNKCLLTMGNDKSSDACLLYDIVTNNLRNARRGIFKNKFFSFRYRCFGILLSYIPSLYKSIVIPVLHAIK